MFVNLIKEGDEDGGLAFDKQSIERKTDGGNFMVHIAHYLCSEPYPPISYRISYYRFKEKKKSIKKSYIL